MDRTKATHRTVVTEIIGNGRYLVVPRWMYLMDRFRYGLSFMPLDCILHHQQQVAMNDRRPIAYSYLLSRGIVSRYSLLPIYSYSTLLSFVAKKANGKQKQAQKHERAPPPPLRPVRRLRQKKVGGQKARSIGVDPKSETQKTSSP